MDVTIDAVAGHPDKFEVHAVTNDWRRDGLMTPMNVIVPRHEIPEVKAGPVPRGIEMTRSRFDSLLADYRRCTCSAASKTG